MSDQNEKPRGATPDGRKRINQTLDEDLHAELKVEAARRRIPLQELIEDWLRQKLAEVKAQGGQHCSA